MKKRRFLITATICILMVIAAFMAGCGDKVILENISIKNLSLKSDYMVGDEIVLTGGILIATYSDGKAEEINITGDMVSGFDSATVGEKYFTVTYQSKIARYYYTVSAKPTAEEPIPEPNYSYFNTAEDADGNLTIIGVIGEYPRELIFPSSIGGKKVIAIDGKTEDNKNAFAGISVDKIVVGEGIERIGDNCFYNCTELDEVILPDSLTELGDYVFESNTSLERVKLGNGLKDLPAGTFCRCTTLVRVELPSDLETIGESAFYRCYALDEVNLPDTVTEIGNYSFQYCNVLRDISLPNVGVISHYAFDSCPILQSAYIPSAVYIGQNAFSNCTTLKSIDLPSTTTIYKSAFYKSGLNTVLFSDKLTNLGEQAFSETSLNSVVLPSSLKTMDKSCFARCNKLSSVSFTAPAVEFTSIPESAFADCTILSGFTVGQGVTSIGENAFGSVGINLDSNNSFQLDLSSATALSVIGGTAFMDANLTGNLTLPDSVEAIGYSAFQSTKIERLEFGDNSKLTTLGNSIGRYTYNLKYVKLPKGISEFSSSWFAGGALEEYDISSTKISAISDNAFSEYSAYDNIIKVLLPDSCKSIGNSAFSNKTKLVTVSGTGVSVVGNNAFYNCGILSDINFLSTLTSVGNNAFQNCKAINSFSFGDNLTTIGNNAFQNCTAITSVNLGEKLTTIGNYAFAGCADISEVNIALESLKKIGDYCFSGDAKLISVNFKGTATELELGQRVFQNCSTLENITIPSGVSKVGVNLFSGCSNLKNITLNITDMTAYGSQNSLGWDSINSLTAIFVPVEMVDAYKEKFVSKSAIIQAVVRL